MITLTSNSKKIYFSSDLHLGAPTHEASSIREKKFVNWLNEIKSTAEAIFLLGDLFDFWFEYKTVVPKGFVRTLGKLAELRDSGIQIYFFVGNHDLWMNDYFQKELNILVFHEPKEFLIDGKLLLIGHGDGLGPNDMLYKRTKKIFTFPLFNWMFRWFHPDLGLRLGQYLSLKNKDVTSATDAVFLGEDKEWLVLYCKRKLEEKHYDGFVFGHRHLPLEIKLNDNSKYTNLGDWVKYFTYGVFENGEMKLLEYK